MNNEDRTYWDKHAKNYARSMAVLGRPIPRMVELAGKAVSGLDRVLEVAAGTGIVTAALSATAREVIATDYSAAMVAALQERVMVANLSNVQCRQADLYKLPLDAESFDAVVAANVLHLVPDLPMAVAELCRVARPGALFVLPTFCHDQTALSWMVSRALAVTGFPSRRRFTAETLKHAIESTGIKIVRMELLSGVIPIGYVEGRYPS